MRSSGSPKKRREAVPGLPEVASELQRVSERLQQVAEQVHFSRALYAEIQDCNQQYAGLIATLVASLKAAADAKLQHQALTIDQLAFRAQASQEAASDAGRDAEKAGWRVAEWEKKANILSEELVKKSAEVESLEQRLAKTEEIKRIDFFRHFEERQGLFYDILY